MRRILLLAAAVACLSAPAAADTLQKIKETGTIVLGVRQDAKPFSFIDGQGQAAGYSVEICQAVAAAAQQQLGLETLAIDYKLVTTENRFQLVQDGTVDLDCGISSYTLTRRADVDFSLLIFATGTDLLVRNGAMVTGLADLADKRIGVLAGSTAETHLQTLLTDSSLTAEVKALPSYTDLLASLETEMIDAAYGDRAMMLAARHRALDPGKLRVLGTIYSYEPYALALRRGDADFRQLVDSTLARLFRSGEIDAIYAEWFGPVADNPVATALYRLQSLPE